jgi:RNA-directed DNA polymerase
MMNGRGKSDPAIVAGKPTNAAERSAAEPAEPRAGTEGNADQQSTDRALSRDDVSQALERIRQAARERKDEKFTSLLHHVTGYLERAFYELKENAAPGVDGLTWRDYEADLERRLEDVRARVHRGAYRALPSRRVYIPKPVRAAASAGGGCAGGQARPASGHRGAERDLRGRLPRVLVRVPAGARRA